MRYKSCWEALQRKAAYVKGTAIGIFCHNGISPSGFTVNERDHLDCLRIPRDIGSVIYGVLHTRFTIGQSKGEWCTGAGGRREKV